MTVFFKLRRLLIFVANSVPEMSGRSRSNKIMELNHNELSCYGIGKEYTKKQWQHLSYQLVQKGILFQDFENHGSLKLTGKAYDIMKGNLTVKGFHEKKETVERPIAAGEAQYDKELFEILRSKRRELAAENNVPPYIIFSDKTLAEMSSTYPRDKDSLLSIHGVGQAKLEKYGTIFMTLIDQYIDKKDTIKNIN